MTPHISPLLIRRNAFLILDLGFHILDGVTGLHLKGDGLPSQGLHEDLHVEVNSRDWTERFFCKKDVYNSQPSFDI